MEHKTGSKEGSADDCMTEIRTSASKLDFFWWRLRANLKACTEASVIEA